MNVANISFFISHILLPAFFVVQLGTMPENINVLFLAAEADPFVKVGGLGDVAGALPRACIVCRPRPGRDRFGYPSCFAVAFGHQV